MPGFEARRTSAVSKQECAMTDEAILLLRQRAEAIRIVWRSVAETKAQLGGLTLFALSSTASKSSCPMLKKDASRFEHRRV